MGKKTLLAYSNSFRALTGNNYRDASSTERERGNSMKLLPQTKRPASGMPDELALSEQETIKQGKIQLYTGQKESYPN